MTETPSSADRDRLTDAAFELAERRGWARLTLSDCADAAGLSVARVYQLAPTKPKLLALAIDRFNEEALATAADDGPAETARDLLFDVVMRRFDAMLPHREGLRAVFFDVRRDPTSWAVLRGPMLRSLRWVLDEAGLYAPGLRGEARLRGVGLLLSRTFRVFLDDGADLSKTMADLDKRLRSREKWIDRTSRKSFARGTSGLASQSHHRSEEETAGEQAEGPSSDTVH